MMPDQNPTKLPPESSTTQLSTSAGAEPKNTPATPEPMPDDNHQRWWKKFGRWYATHKKWSLPASFILLVLILAGVPFTRYHLAGLVLKKDFTIRVLDSDTDLPVSGATVQVGSTTAQTDAYGRARLHVKVGDEAVRISKKYYQSIDSTALVPILSQKDTPDFKLQATGRQVKVSVTNLLTKKNLADVDIEVAGIHAKTDQQGNALLVLPAGVTQEQATLSLDGYNDATVNIKISNDQIEQNSFNLTPAGKLYFLSNRTGTLNVMKANLDGTNPQVVLTGTGNEQTDSTYLSQSPDGKYIALETQRSSSDKTPQLYIISSADDQLLNFDSGNNNFSIVGWSGDTIVYTSESNTMASWQTGKQKLKSYTASTGKISVLDQTTGSDSTAQAGEVYGGVYVAGGYVVYQKYWYAGGQSIPMGEQNSIQQVRLSNQLHSTIANYDATNTDETLAQHSGNSFYLVVDYQDSNSTITYDYTIGTGMRKVDQLSSDQLYGGPSYSYSPDGNRVLWSETRDGQDAFMISNLSGGNATTIATLDNYQPLAWYTDQYVLLTKSDNQLYIMAAAGGTPVKVTDYQATYVY